MSAESLLAVFGAFAAIGGLVIGSFLNVCIARMPEDRSVIWPASHCPRCGTPLGGADLVPVVSWVLLRGRCRHCATRISPVYPLVELLTGLLAWLAFQRFVNDPAHLDAAHLATWAAYFAFLALLVVVFYVDIRDQLIPNQLTVYAVPVAILVVVGLGVLGVDDPVVPSWREGIVAAAVASGTTGLIALGVRLVFGIEGLGWGDVKLLGLMGVMLGPGLLVAFLLGAWVAVCWDLGLTLVRRERRPQPLGPKLALGAAVWVLYGQPVLDLLMPGGSVLFGR